MNAMARPALLLTVLLAAVSAEGQTAASRTAQRVRLVPQFVPGQNLAYQMEWRAASEGTVAGPLADPQAPKKTEVVLNALVRIQVLSTTPDAAGKAPRPRLRMRYENISATTRPDVYDPRLADAAAEWRKLEGQWLEFTLSGEGRPTEITGLEGIAAEQRAVIQDSLAQFSLGARMPEKGVLPGETWRAEPVRPVSAPLANLVWQTESTYLRDEACRPVALTPVGKLEPRATEEACAVILTRFALTQRGKPRDQTPPEYRTRGLRTSGTLQGTGESLSYISLSTGLLVSLTMSANEEMDVTVASEDRSLTVRYTARTHTQSQISLLADRPAP